MIVLTSGKDASIAYCLTTALYCPLPGQYRAIARHKTIRRERKSPLSFLLFTLHQIAWNPDKHRGSERWRVAHHSSPLFTHSSPGYFYSSDYAELTEHSCSTDYARNWNGSSTCSVFEESHADCADNADFPSGVCLPSGVPADLQPSGVPADLQPSGVPADLQPSGVPADLQSAVKKCSTYETRGFAIPPQSINTSGVPADLQSAVKKRSTYETGGFVIPPQSINS